MAWSKKEYPLSMRYLSERARDKAIQIANGLVINHNYDEGKAIVIAINQVRSIDQQK